MKWLIETFQPDNGGKDVIVHILAVERAAFSTLAEGVKVSQEEQERSGGVGREPAGWLITVR